MIQAILFGLGTFESPPLAASAFPLVSPAGLLCRLFRPLLPVGRERSLKYPSGGVLEADDIFPVRSAAVALPDIASSSLYVAQSIPFLCCANSYTELSSSSKMLIPGRMAVPRTTFALEKVVHSSRMRWLVQSEQFATTSPVTNQSFNMCWKPLSNPETHKDLRCALQDQRFCSGLAN